MDDQCPFCGESYVDDSRYCPNCSEYADIEAENEDYLREQMEKD